MLNNPIVEDCFIKEGVACSGRPWLLPLLNNPIVEDCFIKEGAEGSGCPWPPPPLLNRLPSVEGLLKAEGLLLLLTPPGAHVRVCACVYVCECLQSQTCVFVKQCVCLGG